MADVFSGTLRYQVVRPLGEGGMGVVYEVVDHERAGRRVALKVLRRTDAESLLRLKREFRALADLRHPNLAALYELVAKDDAWFFTLELIDGVDFLRWVRPGTPSSQAPTGALQGLEVTLPPAAAWQPERLREAFGQLARGISFLHAHGRVHRDLKPSNVLVTSEGRVGILDFGLVAELDGSHSVTEGEGGVVGTVAYMAPEQAGAAAPTPASDWYAFGVMLFQALTGRLPFEGPGLQVMLDKQRRPAPAPAELLASVTPELNQLCVALLRTDPATRAGELEVRACFGGEEPARLLVPDAPDFVGREPELARLRAALEDSRRGPVLARVVGASGVGKSALLKRFAVEAQAQGAVVLSGRCYERETVPFKALDAIIDALARALVAWPRGRVEGLLPRDVSVLGRMFPVLRRVPAVAEAPAREVVDPQERRRRAVAALRELLARVGDRGPLVVVIDDAQWGDADSAAVLETVLRPPDAPAVLVVIVARTPTGVVDATGLRSEELTLGPLSPAQALALAERLAPGPSAVAWARESHGNPALLRQLLEGGASALQGLEALFAARVAALEPSARRLLELVTVAGTPLAEQEALALAGLSAGDVEVGLGLKAQHLLRAGVDERLEPWHERVRESVLAALSPARVQALHGDLAAHLRAHGGGDFERLAWHLAAAGRLDEAAEATVEAARNAERQLAFAQAAALYRKALELLPGVDARRRELSVAMGAALAHAGRGAAAAGAFSAALEAPGPTPLTPAEALELRRQAAEQLLRNGQVDAGLEAMNAVLASVGMHLARTPRRALSALLLRRAHLAVRGLSFTPTPEASLPREALQRIDACWSVSVGLGMVDTIRGASFQTRQLLLALDAGEPFRVARALAAEAAFVATAGVRAEARARRLLDQAREVAATVAPGPLTGLVDFCAGLSRFLVGQWAEARTLTDAAERQYRDLGLAVSWEAASARLFSVWSLFYLGEVAELSRRIPVLLQEAVERGDRYAQTSLQSGLSNVALLAQGDVAGARAAVGAAVAGWPSQAFHFQHYWAVLSQGLIDLYEGTPELSWARLRAAWPKLEGTQLLRIQNVRIEATFLEGRLALATGRFAEARAAARRLEAEPVAWAQAFAQLLRAVLTPSPEAFRAALERCEAAQLRLFAAALRVQQGGVLGGALGEAQVRAGEGWLITQGIAEPWVFARTLVPAPKV
jgi:hypothetical protein